MLLGLLILERPLERYEATTAHLVDTDTGGSHLGELIVPYGHLLAITILESSFQLISLRAQSCPCPTACRNQLGSRWSTFRPSEPTAPTVCPIPPRGPRTWPHTSMCRHYKQDPQNHVAGPWYIHKWVGISPRIPTRDPALALETVSPRSGWILTTGQPKPHSLWSKPNYQQASTCPRTGWALCPVTGQQSFETCQIPQTAVSGTSPSHQQYNSISRIPRSYSQTIGPNSAYQ